MAKVFFPDHLMQYTAGVREFEVERGELPRPGGAARSDNIPGITSVLIGKVAVAIDGDIIHDPFLDPVRTGIRSIFPASHRGRLT